MLEIDAVSFTWPGQVNAIIDIDHLSVARGERVFLHGPSGCGKTTLLNLIAAVMKPQSGRICVDGVDLTALSGAGSDRFRGDHMGIVFQQFNLLPFLDVIDNVTLPCRFSAHRRSRATANGQSLQHSAKLLLQAMSLDPEQYAHLSAMELSVGQQQRVAVARTLIGFPSLIIADEPTSALDSDTRDAFLQLLFRELEHSSAGTLLFVSHDLSLASAFDRVIDLPAINNGRVATSSAAR